MRKQLLKKYLNSEEMHESIKKAVVKQLLKKHLNSEEIHESIKKSIVKQRSK